MPCPPASLQRSTTTRGRRPPALAALLAGALAACSNAPPPAPAAPATGAAQVVALTDSQLKSVRVAAVAARDFPTQVESIGSIDFDANLSVPVYTPYPGRLLQTFVDLGDEVRRGQPLFSIESPDCLQAESALIGAAATFDQTASALARARALYAAKDIDQNDYETAVANEQSADGALRAARGALAVFGKTEAEIDAIVRTRHVDPALVVRSPVDGRVTARNAAPGLLAQPGVAPAPVAVADLSQLWLLATVTEADSPAFRRGQTLTATVPALPGRTFAGTIDAIGASIDPNTRRVTLRSSIRDPGHELRAGMFANFVIRTGAPHHAPAVPLAGVVREGDGTLSVWVAGADPHRFTRRVVRIGRESDGFDEVLEGLEPGDSVVVDGAILLSNMLFGGAS
jgi:cobalt-zinc-cadmium efflux system membrane fusion protein